MEFSSLTDGFKKSANDSSLCATTVLAKERETIAHNLGMGNEADLESSGLMARSNAAVASLNNLQKRKDKEKRFEDLIYEHMRKSLEAINAEMDWLEEQVNAEETAIQKNNSDIDFIRTLDEDNIMGADGRPRGDVSALLKKHGYDNLDDMEVADIMLVLQSIEVDLHNSNMIRRERIEGYQERHGELRDMTSNMLGNLPEGASPELREEIEATASRQLYEVNYRAMIETPVKEVSESIASIEKQQVTHNMSDGFTFG